MAGKKVIGIFGLNLYSGGSRTHLKNYLKYSSSNENIQLVLFIHHDLFDELDLLDLPIKVRFIPKIFKGKMLIWQLIFSHRIFKEYKLDLLFVPGGIYIGGFRPFIPMCRNMLLFEQDQQLLYPPLERYKLRLKGILSQVSYFRAQKVFFISKYAQIKIPTVFGSSIKSKVIHHGIDSRFFGIWQLIPLGEKVRIVCNSALEPYKRHLELIRSLDRYSLTSNLKIELILIGHKSNLKYARKILYEIMHKESKNLEITILEGLGKEEIIKTYRESNLFVFPSTCENMPNALIEAQATGMPIMCSKIGASEEFIKSHNLKFNPLNQDDFIQVLDYFFKNYGLISRIHKANIVVGTAWSEAIKLTNEELCADLME